MSDIKKLIVNADDFGFSPAVNSAILSGVLAGNITAASLMVNMPFAGYAAQDVRNHCNNLSLALHFTLTSGKPVADSSEIPLLVDSCGLFKFGFFGLMKALQSTERDPLLQQIKIELLAQLQRMNNLAVRNRLRFDHLDSHQHVHVITGIFELLKKEAEKRKLSLRIPRENFGSIRRMVKRSHSWFPQGFIKRMILNKHLKHAQQNIGYFGILESGKMNEYSLHEIIRTIQTSNSNFNQYELNIHPSDFSITQNDELLCCSVGDYKFHRSQSRFREFQALQNTKFRNTLNKYNIKLTGFPR
ncbi:MAG: ChbG/HpnK family deacetylase [Planctomycetaceae bacterium]|nr:ChbG/HpnK family deacetylase [Planctomycetaceae bacterium]